MVQIDALRCYGKSVENVGAHTARPQAMIYENSSKAQNRNQRTRNCRAHQAATCWAGLRTGDGECRCGLTLFHLFNSVLRQKTPKIQVLIHFVDQLTVDGFSLQRASDRHRVEAEVVDVPRNSSRVVRNQFARFFAEYRLCRPVPGNPQSVINVSMGLRRIKRSQPCHD